MATDETLHHTSTHEEHGQITTLLDFDDRPFKLTANVVCAGCNGGWMSRLEVAAKSYLDGMLEGRGRELHAGGQADLARWALLKAIIFDQAAPPQARVMFRPLYAGLYDNGDPPEAGCRVWLSAYGGELPGFTALTALAASTEGQVYTAERNVCVRTFSLGPVLFQVFATSNPTLGDYDPGWAALEDPPQVIQIWPAGNSVRWMPQPSLNDRGIVWFANHIVATMAQESVDHHP
jgi:hypothetical protein